MTRSKRIISIALVATFLICFTACTKTETKSTTSTDTTTEHVHVYTTLVSSFEANDTEPGYDVYKCECGNETITNFVPALVAPVKGDEVSDETINTAEHEHRYAILMSTVEATDTEVGYDIYKCKYCDSEVKMNYTPATGATVSE